MSALAVPTRLKLTLAQYRAMGERGILPPGERVELIDGEIIRMAPIGPPHTGVLNQLNDRLVTLCKGKAVISAQHPVEVDDYNEPQPDLGLLRWRDNYYIDRHPTPADVLLLIEISDSSLRYDRSVKRALYARAGVPRYWIVDIVDRSVIVFGIPGPDGYRSEQRYSEGERLPLGDADSPLAGLTLDVSEIIGHLPSG